MKCERYFNGISGYRDIGISGIGNQMIASLFVSQFWQSWQFWQSVLHLTIQELGLRAVFTITLAVALALPGLAQTSDDPVAQGQKRSAVRITHGPVAELVTDTTAQVAWSTNVNA